MFKGKRKSQYGRSLGFSLVELMVVISIIGLLSTIVAVNVLKSKGKAAGEKCKADFKAFDDAIILFHNDTGQFPSSLDDLIQGSVDGWDGPYIKGGQRALLDPWKRPYLYQYSGGGGDTPYIIMSYGADGTPGGDGENRDISSQDMGGGRR
jgi:general secretion pathway protein G